MTAKFNDRPAIGPEYASVAGSNPAGRMNYNPSVCFIFLACPGRLFDVRVQFQKAYSSLPRPLYAIVML
jgi:hypothetical protein